MSRDKNSPPPRRAGLGKGLSSLLGDPETEPVDGMEPPSAEEVRGAVLTVRVSDIEPNPHQPRKLFDDEALKNLAASLKEDGVLQPAIVTRAEKPGRYVLIAGERRWRASKLAGLDVMPVIVKEGSPDDLLRLALIENIQRADLNVVEEAEAYASLIKDFGLTQEQVATRVGKDRTSVTNALRLLALPREIQDDMMDGRLTMGHGRALLTLEDKKLMLRARDLIIKKQLNVRQAEQLCKSFKADQAGEKAGATGELPNADLNYLADSLRSYLRTKVKLSGSGTRGRIEISYFSAAELERLMGLIGHKF